MRRTTRYILGQLAVSAAISCTVLCLMIWLSQILRFLDLVVDGGAPFSVFLQLATLALPSLLIVVIPVAVVTAVLFTYHRLGTENELVVMRAAGMSPMQLARPALTLGVLASAVLLVLSFQLAPAAQKELEKLRQLAQNKLASVLLRPGVFNDAGNKLTVYAREKDDSGQLRGILINDSRNPEKPVTIIAEKGVFLDDGHGARVLVFNGNRQEMDKTRDRLSELFFEQYTISLKAIRPEYASHLSKPDERSIGELWTGMEDPASRTRLLSEFHSRLMRPMLPLAFAVMAVTVLLSGEINRRGHHGKILGVVAGVVLIQAASLTLTRLAGQMPLMAVALHASVWAPVLAGLWILGAGNRTPLRAAGK